MSQVRTRFGKRFDAVSARHRRRTESAQLWEDEPHPMRPLPARAKLGLDGGIDRSLSDDESLQVVSVRLSHSLHQRVADR